VLFGAFAGYNYWFPKAFGFRLHQGLGKASFAALILVGIGLQVARLVVSIRRRGKLRDEYGNPWDGRSLEWATSSSPPVFNFAALPNVQGE
jgi:cytochrome o ubiquinol oxidase subunit I